jgi:hypothetical protein
MGRWERMGLVAGVTVLAALVGWTTWLAFALPGGWW